MRVSASADELCDARDYASPVLAVGDAEPIGICRKDAHGGHARVDKVGHGGRNVALGLFVRGVLCEEIAQNIFQERENCKKVTFKYSDE